MEKEDGFINFAGPEGAGWNGTIRLEGCHLVDISK